MRWIAITIMSQRFEFVKLALQEGVNFSELCRRFSISRPTGYNFLYRYQQEGYQGLCDRSKRPKYSPHITAKEIEQANCTLDNLI